MREFLPQRLLQVGGRAPDFTLVTTTGDSIHLYEVLQRSPVVLFFLIKAFTPVCTAEVCGFRDQRMDFDQAGGVVFGVSADRPAIAKQFAQSFDLPFPLLLDSEQRVRNMYCVSKVFGLLPGRATFVIRQYGKVKQVIQDSFQEKQHIRKSLEALRAKG